ncbi:MAG: hypothetical protein QXL67_03930, partial [Candidatus Bathyarchaeia archaeon]
LAKTEVALSEFLSEYPKYYLKRVDLPYPKILSERIVEEIASRHRDEDLDLTDGLKICGDKEWVLIRPSKTEHKIRVWAEARSLDRAELLCKSMVEEVSSLYSEIKAVK